VEYATPISLTLDVQSRPGTLSVFTRESDVNVFIDGALVGHTPLHVQVPAGDHEVVLRAPGYQVEEREVSVPSEGSAQVRAALERVPGAGPADGDEEGGTRPRSSGLMLALGYGFQSPSYRYVFDIGGRLASGHIDAAVTVGYYGEGIGGAIGGTLRYYPSTRAFRPFARASFLVGNETSASSSNEAKLFAVEGAGGVLIAPRVRGSKAAAYQYFAELGVQAMINPPDGTSTLSIPLVFGVIVSTR
jgi:hypothetical protein